MDKDQAIREYQRAYEVANGKPAPEVTYNSGWFRIGRPSQPVRLRELLLFRDRLLDRASKRGGAP